MVFNRVAALMLKWRTAFSTGWESWTSRVGQNQNQWTFPPRISYSLRQTVKWYVCCGSDSLLGLPGPGCLRLALRVAFDFFCNKLLNVCFCQLRGERNLEQLRIRSALQPSHDLLLGVMVGGAETNTWTWSLLTSPLIILISNASHDCRTSRFRYSKTRHRDTADTKEVPRLPFYYLFMKTQGIATIRFVFH